MAWGKGCGEEDVVADPKKKKPGQQEDKLTTVLKYVLLAGVIIGIGYASYAGQSANRRDLATLRASCAGGGGLTGFGTCR